jgi:hypothetical protein
VIDLVVAGNRRSVLVLKTLELRTQSVPFRLVCFSDTVKGPIKNLFFVVLLPDGTVVVLRVEKRL